MKSFTRKHIVGVNMANGRRVFEHLKHPTSLRHRGRTYTAISHLLVRRIYICFLFRDDRKILLFFDTTPSDLFFLLFRESGGRGE